LRVLPEDVRDFFLEFAGYCLTTDVRHELALWLVGPRGSGKSTLITGLLAMLGELAGVLRLGQVADRFGLAGIEGKTLLYCTEVPKAYVRATDIINMIISGEPIPVERKNVDAYEYTPVAKLLWSFNTLPSLYDQDNGIYRRVQVIDVPRTFEVADPEIKECVKLEGAGIANLAIQHLANLRKRKAFDIPRSVLERTEEFKQTNDLARSFLDDCCELPDSNLYDKKKYTEQSSALTHAFNVWAKANGYEPRSAKFLAPEWKRLGLLKGRDKHGAAYTGVMIRKDVVRELEKELAV
jgi:putative DNA primase/helicase